MLTSIDTDGNNINNSLSANELAHLTTMTKTLQDSICNMDCDNCNFCHGDFMNCAIGDFRDCLQMYINECN